MNNIATPTADSLTIGDDIATQAAEWLLKLSSEEPEPSPEDYAAFEQWKNTDPRHAKAVSNMEDIVGRLQMLPTEPAVATLKNRVCSANHKPNDSWASLAKTLSIAACLLLPLWLLLPQQQLASYLADQRTGTGEWQTHTLSDNSQILLSSNSAINVQFTPQQRIIELVQGEILLDVGKDAVRPFIVQTKLGSFTALGTRFTVQQTEQNKEQIAILTVLESTVSAQVAFTSTSGERTLSPGQRIRLYNNRLGNTETLDTVAYEQAWRSHQLVVQGLPLVKVLEQIKPFYSGHLSYNAEELVGLRVYAVLPLDEPQRALQLLSESFPVEVNTFTPWWVNVERR